MLVREFLLGDCTCETLLPANVVDRACCERIEFAGADAAAYAGYSAEIREADAGYDYTKREVMIPMRDGVKLYTVIVIPNGAKNAPILLTRTPYDAAEHRATAIRFVSDAE